MAISGFLMARLVVALARAAMPPNVDFLNRDCACLTVDQQALEALLTRGGVDGLYGSILAKQPHLFSSVPVFLSRANADAIVTTVSAIERTIAKPSYVAAALARAPHSATHSFGPLGVFYGYDFHLGSDGPKLIEINTNAGGALLNAILGQAQKACCPEMAPLTCTDQPFDSLEDAFVSMFRREYALQRGDKPLCTVAIVDDDPEAQYLHPEFLLFQQMFRAAGLEALIVSGSTLTFEGGALSAGGRIIDLVYNRLTDFYFEAQEHRALGAAYEQGAVVVTPSPRGHALYADKRNLVALSDPERLADLGVDAATIAVLLSSVPRTLELTSQNRDAMWKERKKYFFKPVAGYAGKAAYRGDKLTTSTWAGMTGREYVAQEIVRPTERTIIRAGERIALKLDLRAYVYDGQVQLMAARLYEGQTTNFRTAGGGFASVFTEKSRRFK
ncbi:MAG: hypothetical protein SFV15_19035 [Polyangiaceae bacterium]|nr:hypothetical protein [Polyangiaceae bacterium]